MILLTGSNGFLGKIIYRHLSDQYEVDTLSRKDSTYNVDLALNSPKLKKSYQTVIHSAGKAHLVPKNDEEAKAFYDVNVNGTKNLLAAFERTGNMPDFFVFISTVATYGLESGENINEDSILAASEPYGKSKVDAESLITKWCNQHHIICTILRLPLVAGPNPPGNLNAMIKGILKGYYFNISGIRARKSIVLAVDVANIIMSASKVGGVFNLSDGYHPTFQELSELMAKQLSKERIYSIPLWFAIFIAKMGDLMGGKAPLDSKKLNKIVSNLTFDDTKARRLIDWKPTPVLSGFVIR